MKFTDSVKLADLDDTDDTLTKKDLDSLSNSHGVLSKNHNGITEFGNTAHLFLTLTVSPTLTPSSPCVTSSILII